MIKISHSAASLFLLVFSLLNQVQAYAQPAIVSVNPSSGPAGSSVTISGINFDASVAGNIVYFGPVRAVVSSASNNSLTVIVPSGATSESISVTVNSLTAYSPATFHVTYPTGGFITQGSLKNTGNPVALKSDLGIYGMVTRDFDGDGKSDIATVDGMSRVFILKNTSQGGTLSFAPTQSFSTGGAPYVISAADFNGDGKLDVVTGNYMGGDFTVLQNTSEYGSLSFSGVIGYWIGSLGVSLDLGDFNGDGKPDIVGTNGSTAKIFRNTSTVSKVSFSAVSTDMNVGEQMPGDVDRDGKADLVTIDGNRTTLEILRSTSSAGGITFSSALKMPVSNARILFIRDLTGDNKPDLGISNGGKIMVYPNTGTTGSISFGTPVQLNPMNGFPGGRSTKFEDIDGDGREDLVYVLGTNICIAKNTGGNGKILFDNYIAIPAASYYSIAVGDFQGDGKLDVAGLISSTRTVGFLLNQTAAPLVTPTGASPVAGQVNITVSVDTTVVISGERTYVQRHFDVQPPAGGESASATVTLLFTQQDFTAFNAAPNHPFNLPAGPDDAAGKSALRIYQYHGASSTGTIDGYGGDAVVINPDDDKIVWNAATQNWEVTFDIAGFSGFYIGTLSNAILPVDLVSFSGRFQHTGVFLEWTTQSSKNLKSFEVQRSSNGVQFTPVQELPARESLQQIQHYQAQDSMATLPVYYYRLKMIDLDGSSSVSRVVKVARDVVVNLRLYPNPAHNYVIVGQPASQGPAQIALINSDGRTIKRLTVARGQLETYMDLTGCSKGIYKIVWSAEKETRSQSLIIN